MDRLNKNFKVKVEILSPVHIGGGSEKNWIKGINYDYLRDNEVTYFDLDNILTKLNEKELKEISDAISSQKACRYIADKIKEGNSTLKRFAKTFYVPAKPENEIKSMIRTGLGKPIIPGSSIKGAIRSCIFKYLYNNSNELRSNIDSSLNNDVRYYKPDEAVFGKIDNNLMRLISISDAEFDETELFISKIFNLLLNNGDWAGGWKHQQNKGNSEDFESTGFTTTYETLMRYDRASIRIGFAEGVLKNMDKYHFTKPKYSDKLFDKGGNALHTLFGIINNNTLDYIKKEKAFFGKYNNNETEFIIEELNEIENAAKNESNDTCVLHLGAGSGFHGITGDWRFDDHTVSIEKPDRKNNKWNNETRQLEPLRYKSRKFAFDYKTEDGEINDFLLLPMGFVKLYDEEYYDFD